ncbi:MAG: ubiquinol-cytochrome c reductase cytochrome c1 subunit [Campylobacterota bacterium]|nr:ubiquinol-cytochrome c reductase cytochrome c1 subunit [Campylobacterota bacterium]
MRELKILAVVVFFTLVTYWGVEPFAHSQMHKHVEGHGFTYNGTADTKEAEAGVVKAKESGSKEAEAQAKLEAKKVFWADVEKIAQLQGNAANGEAAFATCLGCHNGSGVNMGGVIPPNLDHAGALYDKNYLIALIKDPAMASNVDHKYEDTMTHPMGSIKTMVTDDQQIADIVAYMQEKMAGEVTSKQAFDEACARCHAMRYAKTTQLGDTPTFKYEKDALAHKIKVIEEQEMVKAYMGKLPPDLSIMVRARSEHFMETFVENPQAQLPGTSMPRVGLSHEGYEKVKAYLEEVGDPSKPAREAIGPWVLLFFVVFTVLAYLWKKSQWKDLH